LLPNDRIIYPAQISLIRSTYQELYICNGCNDRCSQAQLFAPGIELGCARLDPHPPHLLCERGPDGWCKKLDHSADTILSHPQLRDELTVAAKKLNLI
jgi:hypothetical protein